MRTATIHRVIGSYETLQEKVNEKNEGTNFKAPQYESSVAILTPQVDISIKGQMQYKYNMPANQLIPIFEQLLQISHADGIAYFWTRVNEHYANLHVRVPKSGITLNVETYPIDVKVNKRMADGTYQKVEDTIEMPENPYDYIIYMMCKNHKFVAPAKDRVLRHLFYLEEDYIIKESILKNREKVNKAKAFALNVKEEDVTMYLYLFRNLGIKDSTLNSANLSTATKEVILPLFDSLVEKYPDKFIQIYEDENGKLKYYIELMVYHGLLDREKGEYFYDTNPIGSNIDAVIKWLKSPANVDSVSKLRSMLHLKMKGVANVDVEEFKDLLTNGRKKK